MMNDRSRARLIQLCGLAIIALGVISALLPVANGVPSFSIGLLLIAAGAVEIFAGRLRQEVHVFAASAGAVTALAGLLVTWNPSSHLFPTVWPVILWLIARSAILFWSSRHTGGSVHTWTAISAGMDLVLAVLLIAGLSIAALVVSLFGPTQPLIAHFAWILAASFVVTGNLLLEVANCERAGA